MTTIYVEWAGENIQKLTVSGHANFAQSGCDIVCAAVSILITTGANALETVAGILPEVRQDEENTEISVSLPFSIGNDTMHDAQIVMQTVFQGFKDIALTYSDYLRIIDGRKSSC